MKYFKSFTVPLSLLFLAVIFSCQAQNNSKLNKEIEKVEIKSKPKLIIGATLNFDELNTIKEELFLKDFNFLTPANAAKQTRIHPEPDVWNWVEVDSFIRFAKKHNLTVRLHGPMSPQASKWAKTDTRTAEELETNLIEFTTAFAKHFNDEPIVEWMDVVNETIERDGSWFGPKEGVDEWENPWINMGFDENGYPLYILKAFEIATKNAPNIKLVYNQNVGMETVMWNKVKETVTYIRSKGYRVDAIGWQAHLLLGAKREDFVDNIDQSMQKLSDLIDWAHANDLGFHITELDYLVRDMSTINEERKIQAMVYKKMVDVLKSKISTGVITLNLWDLGEREKKELGVFQSIYDADFNPTPAYKVIMESKN